VLSIDAVSGGRRTPGVMRLTPGGAVDGGFGSGGVRLRRRESGVRRADRPGRRGRIVTAAEIPARPTGR
jgi:hypothetical protein